MDKIGRFIQFVDNNKYVEECKNIVPRKDCALIQIFVYRDSGLLVDSTSIALGDKDTRGGLHLHHYAKMLHDSENYKAGDIVKMPNSLSDKPQKNPAWEIKMKAYEEHPMSEEKPDPKEEYIGEFAINIFMKSYGFHPKPFKAEAYKDIFIALIPEYVIEGKMDPELMIK